MTSAFEAAGTAMADGVRATFGFAATDVAALKNDVVRGYGAVKNLSAGNDMTLDRTLDI